MCVCVRERERGREVSLTLQSTTTDTRTNLSTTTKADILRYSLVLLEKTKQTKNGRKKQTKKTCKLHFTQTKLSIFSQLAHATDYVGPDALSPSSAHTRGSLIAIGMLSLAQQTLSYAACCPYHRKANGDAGNLAREMTEWRMAWICFLHTMTRVYCRMIWRLQRKRCQFECGQSKDKRT